MDNFNNNFNNINKTINKSVETTKNLGQSISNKTRDFGEKLSNTSQKILESSESNNIKNNFEKLTKTPLSNLVEEKPAYFLNFDFDFSFFKSFAFWAIIILILAILGFNIFNYLSQGTDIIAAITGPIISTLGILTGETAKTTISNTATGTKKIVDTTSNVGQNALNFFGKTINKGVDGIDYGSNKGIDFIENRLKKINNNENINETNKPDIKIDNLEQKRNNNILSNRENRLKQNNKNNNLNRVTPTTEQDPEPVQSSSQQHGYCYIGKINDSRYCTKVTAKNKCMSGDIFPSMDLCINPNIR
tara:strand:- start:124 stop:1035 length:912 start_codon:yes stop_codon:yes gene_type:complete